MSSSASIFAPVTFTGVSQYATDFVSVLTRANAIAQIPITILKNQAADIASRDTSLGSLSTAVSALGQTLKKIGGLGSGGSLAASTTDATAVTATVTGATAPASYVITNITSVASAAAETTTSGYADPLATPVAAIPAGSTSASLDLLIGTTHLPITLSPEHNNLAGLRDAINALSNSGLTASILSTGSGSSGNYLSISANSTGATTLTLTDNTTGINLLKTDNQGSDSIFQLNGIPVDKKGTTINDVIPGVTLNILGKTISNEAVGVKLTSDSSLVSSSLQALATNYNAVAIQVNSQIGPTAGLLSGNNIIYQIRQAMSHLVQYQGTGAITSLATLGIEMNLDGTMTFNQTTFNGLSDSQISSAFSLLGSATAGIGGLQTAFSAVSDSVSGTIVNQQRADAATTTRLNAHIAILTAQITASETTLNAQLQAADAAVANLQSIQTLLTSSINSLNFTSFGKTSSSS